MPELEKTEITRPFALITGASKGIGKAFAEACAEAGYNLYLVALPGEGLETVAKSIAASTKRNVLYREADLTREGVPELIHEEIHSHGYKVAVLINNAGFGTHGDFLKTPAPVYATMLNLNMTVVQRMIHLFLPDMKNMEEAWIINMGSAAGFMPGVPYKAAYGASKAFVLSFSRGLQRELKHTGVSVSCICPNGVITNETVRKRIAAAGFFARKGALEPYELVDYAFKNRRKKKVLLIPGLINKAVYLINWIIPVSLSITFVEQTFARKSE